MMITKKALANALALTATLYWIIEYLLFLLLPASSVILRRVWLSLITLGQGDYLAELLIFFIGGPIFIISAWILGYVFGWSIEYFSKREDEEERKTGYTI